MREMVVQAHYDFNSGMRALSPETILLFDTLK